MKAVRITYHEEPEGWWAESDEIPGWTAAGDTFEEVREQVRSAVNTFVGRGVAVHEEGGPLGHEARR